MERTAAVWTSITELIANPTANLTASVLLLAAVTLILLILALGALLWIMSSGQKRGDRDDVPIEHRETDESRSGADAQRTWLTRVSGGVVLALVLVAAVSGYVLTGQDDACLGCHEQVMLDLAAETTATVEPTTVHGDSRCVDCHESATWPLGFLGNSIDRVHHLVTATLGDTPVVRPVGSDRCLACHKEIAEETIENPERGVRVSHAEPLAAGMVCVECHVGTPHDPKRTGPGMSACVTCHDSETADASCVLCHQGETSDAAQGRSFPAQRLVPFRDCAGCHPQDTCDECHGLRMPHTAEFEAYDHARYAGFDLKELCWRCHTIGDCQKCHETKEGIWGHGTGDVWRTQHAMIGHENPGGCGCHAAHPAVSEQGNFCVACH